MSTSKTTKGEAKRAGRRKPGWAKVGRFSVSLPGPMARFIEERGSKHYNGVSGLLQDFVRPHFEADEAAKGGAS